MHKNNRVVQQKNRDHSTDTQPSTGVPAPQEPALNISGLDTTALTRLCAHRRRLLQELGGRRIPDGAQEAPWRWALHPQAEAEPPQLFDPHLPAEALEKQGIEYLRLCRALMMRLAEPADNIVAQALTAFGPAFTAHVLASGGRIPHSVWENGEPDPVLHAILMQRSPGYRPGEHETTREELEKALAARSKRWARCVNTNWRLRAVRGWRSLKTMTTLVLLTIWGLRPLMACGARGNAVSCGCWRITITAVSPWWAHGTPPSMGRRLPRI